MGSKLPGEKRQQAAALQRVVLPNCPFFARSHGRPWECLPCRSCGDSRGCFRRTGRV